MLFSEIRPFVRFARYLHLNQKSFYEPHIPCDARLFYVMDGCGRIDTSRHSYSLKKGSLVFINAGIEYHLATPESDVTYLVLNFDYTFTHSSLSVPVPPKTRGLFRSEHIIERISFEDISELDETVCLQDCFEVERNLIKIEEEYSHCIIYSDIKISSLFSEILIDLFRKIKFQPDSNNINNTKNINPRIIIDYIYENYNTPLNNTDIGILFGYHPNYISTLVKLYTGLPLHQYIMHIRIVRATKYLDMGTMSISEIAKECGFETPNYFSRYFKKVTGISPTQYIKQ